MLAHNDGRRRNFQIFIPVRRCRQQYSPRGSAGHSRPALLRYPRYLRLLLLVAILAQGLSLAFESADGTRDTPEVTAMRHRRKGQRAAKSAQSSDLVQMLEWTNSSFSEWHDVPISSTDVSVAAELRCSTDTAAIAESVRPSSRQSMNATMSPGVAVASAVADAGEVSSAFADVAVASTVVDGGKVSSSVADAAVTSISPLATISPSTGSSGQTAADSLGAARAASEMLHSSIEVAAATDSDIAARQSADVAVSREPPPSADVTVPRPSNLPNSGEKALGWG